MLADAVLADLVVKQYVGLSAYPWGTFDPGETDGICWASVVANGVTHVILRGSDTWGDWLKDGFAVANPFTHDVLGPCHPGMYVGMHELWAEIQGKTNGPRVVCGHSLGAGRAQILAAIMLLDGSAPIRCVCFGSPKPGMQKLAGVLKGIPIASYRNGDATHHDAVTDLAFRLWPLEEYVHPVTQTLVTATPDPAAGQTGMFAWHHSPLYAAALKAMESTVGPTSAKE